MNFKFNTMKKILFVLVFVTMAVASQAQLFVGGYLGFNRTGGNSEITTVAGNTTVIETDYSPRVSNFDIRPMVGYMMSDAIGFGVTVGYESTTTKECTNVENKEFNEKTTDSGFGFAPFFRYVFGDFEKIKLYADAKLPLVFGSRKYEHFVGDNLVKDKGPKLFEIGFNIVPSFSYQFNDHVSFNAELGLLSLGWNQKKVSTSNEYELGGVTVTEDSYNKTSNFGIGVNNRVPVQFGLIYTF